MDSPTESIATTASLDVKGDVQGDTPLVTEIAGDYLQRTRPNETCQCDTPGGSGSAVRRSALSAPRSGLSAQSWGVVAWNASTHGHGATSSMQPNDTDVHQEFRTASMQDEDNQQRGDDTLATKVVRFNGMDTVHYTVGRSSDAAAKAPPPPLPDPVPYTGSGVRVAVAHAEAVVAARADRDKWERASRWNWWQSNDEWSRR